MLARGGSLESHRSMCQREPGTLPIVPTAVRKRGARYVAVDKRTGKTLTKPTTKRKASIFASIRDRDVKPRRRKR